MKILLLVTLLQLIILIIGASLDNKNLSTLMITAHIYIASCLVTIAINSNM